MDERIKVQFLLCKEDSTYTPHSSNEFNSIFWFQRELQASQTLTDLATKGKKDEDFRDRQNYSKYEQNSNQSYRDPNLGKNIPNTLPTCLSSKISEQETIIARALEDLCSNGRKRTTLGGESLSISQLQENIAQQSQMKPKKKRRRRHEIIRNFRCVIDGCNKSYGSEGALKTHIRLKHTHSESTHEEINWIGHPSGTSDITFLTSSSKQSLPGDRTSSPTTIISSSQLQPLSAIISSAKQVSMTCLSSKLDSNLPTGNETIPVPSVSLPTLNLQDTPLKSSNASISIVSTASNPISSKLAC